MTSRATLTVIFPFESAKLQSFDGRGELSASGSKLTVTDITDGCVIVLKD